MAGEKPIRPAKAPKKRAPRGAAAKAARRPSRAVAGTSASRRIDQRILGLGGWRAETLARMRALILEADPGMAEEWKWNTPVWAHHGIVCTGEAYSEVVKLTFARGARIPDPASLFNASLGGSTRRAIDIREGQRVDVGAFKALVKAAVAANSMPARPKVLSGGNPQIAKGEGDAPVQAYIAAMPGWKRDIGRRLDAIVARSVPGVRKAVKWNSPFYGVEGLGWFLSFHTFANYVKVAFFRGVSLRPVPPGESRHKDVRYLDIREDDELDEAQLASWMKQASRLPGWGRISM